MLYRVMFNMEERQEDEESRKHKIPSEDHISDMGGCKEEDQAAAC